MEERLVLERRSGLDRRACPEGQKRGVAVVIAARRDALGVGDRGQLIPDGRQGGGHLGVVVPVGLAGVLVEAVGERFPGERAEVPIERRVSLSERADHRQVRKGFGRPVWIEIRVVADREGIGRGQGHPGVVRGGRRPLEEAVHSAEVVFDQPALPAVIRVAVPAALEVWSERVVGIGVAVGCRHESQVVPAVGTGQPAEEVVERPVLHHEYHDVTDATRAVGPDHI